MDNILPVTNDNGYFEMRLESIGGLGANLCGKMLGELGALYLSLNASSFSSYGSEKRGSPVKAYIRWCNASQPIRINSPVIAPHILCIFHEGLLGKLPVLNGVTKDTKIILNTALSPEEARERWDFPQGTLYCVDALTIAMESHSRINMVLLGAIAKASGFIPLASVEQLCQDTIGQKYPALIESNLTGVRKGYDSLSEGTDLASPAGSPTENALKSAPGPYSVPLPENAYTWGYDNAPIGGINTRPGSTISNDLSPSREGYMPLFLQEKCINCGLCDSTCPDMVFQFKKGIYKDKPAMVNTGLDYHHCKGCLRCVAVCPTGALVKALEKDYPEKPWFVPNRDLLPDSIAYEETGPNSWITSDSYMDEKRVDGGVV
ncbi:MAG: 2-oxoacid:acceptor oxidoreductase family protein [Lachnospiraceae bacterium]